MSSSHLWRVLRPTCNYKRIYLSRTLPLYRGVFHRHSFSDTPIRFSQLSSEVTLPVEPVQKRKPRAPRKPRLTEEDEAALNASSNVATLPVELVRKRKPRAPRKPRLTEEDEAAALSVSSSEATLPVEPVRKRKPRAPRKPRLTEEDEATLSVSSSEATLPVKQVRKRKPRASRKSLLTEEDEAALSVSKLNLPPIDKWRHYFAIMEGQRLRFFLRNPDTARMLAEAIVPEGSKDLIVIEAAAGPGQLTRALLNLPKERIKKLIVLETPPKLLEFLKPLEAFDSRVHVFPWSSKDWNSYTKLFSTGLLDELQTVDWEKVHPQLRCILHINSTVEGEQLLAQLLRAIPDRQWLFKYGRVPIHFNLSSRMWDRVRGPPSTMARCKVSVMAQAAADLSEAVPYDALQPFQDHFHPTVPQQGEIGSKYHLDERRTGNPMSVITAIPLQNQIIEPGDLDYWDYCLRKLFVQKATPLHKCISLLGPGAKNILDKLTNKTLPAEERVDTKKNPRSLELHEWALLVRAFKEWPFRPEDLSIDTFFVGGDYGR